MTQPHDLPLEGEGLPEVADDATPERARVPEPQEVPLPGDEPVAVQDYGTTVEEQLAGEPLDGRLAREEPEPQVDPLRPRHVDEPRDDIDPADALSGADDLAGFEREPGRLVEEDEGAHTDVEKDAVAMDVADRGGLSAEESAIHLDPHS